MAVALSGIQFLPILLIASKSDPSDHSEIRSFLRLVSSVTWRPMHHLSSVAPNVSRDLVDSREMTEQEQEQQEEEEEEEQEGPVPWLWLSPSAKIEDIKI